MATKQSPDQPRIVDPDGRPVGGAAIVPPMTASQRREAEERIPVATLVVHETVRWNGVLELRRSVHALAWSGFAAGLSMGFSFLAETLFRAYLPAAPWRPLIVNLGYPLGFIIVITGRQQLFTENTLTAIIPLLAARNLATLKAVIRLCGGAGRESCRGSPVRAGAGARTGPQTRMPPGHD